MTNWATNHLATLPPAPATRETGSTSWVSRGRPGLRPQQAAPSLG